MDETELKTFVSEAKDTHFSSYFFSYFIIRGLSIYLLVSIYYTCICGINTNTTFSDFNCQLWNNLLQL